MKIRGKRIDEISAYRALFISATLLALIVGIFAIQNNASIQNINDSLVVGQYQDNAELTKYKNDTKCLYGTENQAEFAFDENKDVSLDCLQYSRNLHEYFLEYASPSFDPNFQLNYGYEDIQKIIELCSVNDNATDFVEIGTLGEIDISCKQSPERGKYVEMGQSATIERMIEDAKA